MVKYVICNKTKIKNDFITNDKYYITNDKYFTTNDSPHDTSSPCKNPYRDFLNLTPFENGTLESITKP
jgi:hypothetical protein